MNCKPGDMAEVLSGPNKGAIVLVEQYDPLWSDELGAPVWKVRPAWPSLVIAGRNAGEYRIEDCFCPDSELRPIRPPETPVTTDVPEGLTV